MIERLIDGTYHGKQAQIEVKEMPEKHVIIRTGVAAHNGAALWTAVLLDDANARRLRDALTAILDRDGR